MLLRPDAPLFFINAHPLHSQIRELVAAYDGQLKTVILDLNASSDVEIAVSDMLKTLHGELNEAGIRLLLVNIMKVVRGRLENSELIEEIGEKNIYLSVQDAVNSLSGKNYLSES